MTIGSIFGKKEKDLSDVNRAAGNLYDLSFVDSTNFSIAALSFDETPGSKTVQELIDQYAALPEDHPLKKSYPASNVELGMEKFKNMGYDPEKMKIDEMSARLMHLIM